MYDYLFIDTNKLPVSDEKKNIIGKNPDWQTKSLDCELTEVYITDDNFLKINKFEYEEVPKEKREFPNDTSIKGFIGSVKRINERLETTPYTGSIIFYSNVNTQEEWYEFKADFVSGKLTSLISITT